MAIEEMLEALNEIDTGAHIREITGSLDCAEQSESLNDFEQNIAEALSAARKLVRGLEEISRSMK